MTRGRPLCGEKIPYRSKRAAQAVRKGITGRRRNRVSPAEVEVYKCPSCNHWHIRIT
jgi:predicted RNA-binding Zn-ribbon protein involved in translation (DUF1610 family)